MKTKDFDYSLPKKFIAQKPKTPRDHSKLMVYDTKNDKVHHLKFFQIADLLGENDVLVANSSKVVPARIIFHENGKEREIFVLGKTKDGEYEILVRPGKAFKKGAVLSVNKKLRFEVKDIKEDGIRVISFGGGRNVDKELEKVGQSPFPPYIKTPNVPLKRYQTIYAKEKGSVAAPTAGLHFTGSLIKNLRGKGVDFEKVILHVGLGTFAPVKAEDIKDHIMHHELFEMPLGAATTLTKAKSSDKRIVAVGTTSVRVLETSFKNGEFHPQISKTDIFIYPGYKWKTIDALITNFHLPKSTLLMLVSSFLEHKGVKNPIKKLLHLYELAKKQNYRFYSFGDAMFIF